MSFYGMTSQCIHHTRARFARLGRQLGARALGRPGLAAALLAGIGLVSGAGASTGIGFAQRAQLRQQVASQQRQLDATRQQAQRDVNALAARLGELQAQATRLNALGERLTRTGQLADGEFDFDKPAGIGGVGPTRDMPSADLRGGMDQLASQLTASGEQLSVLESLLFNRKLDADATPSRMPITPSYVTSAFGARADPFGGGAGFHKGIDFHANTGDPVLSVADGVVKFSGVRSGYGNVVEIDHGNGYVTRYAHNSRLLVQTGDLVRSGEQVAKAGSSGRSTGPHVHFELLANGAAINPGKFLRQAPVARG